MTNLLSLKSSLFGDEGVSNQLIDEFRNRLSLNGVGVKSTVRDLYEEKVHHLDSDWLAAIAAPNENRTAEQSAMATYSDQLIAELQQAELVVIGAPMYNFTIPSVMKAWLDHIARAGVTFKYTESGPVGLLTNKKVVVIATMGGDHEEGKTDHLRPYLKTILGFIGLTDIEIITAVGLNLGQERRDLGIKTAKLELVEIADQISQAITIGSSDREAA